MLQLRGCRQPDIAVIAGVSPNHYKQIGSHHPLAGRIGQMRWRVSDTYLVAAEIRQHRRTRPLKRRPSLRLTSLRLMRSRRVSTNANTTKWRTKKKPGL